jgi:bifunctional oligoribonuclease and PAP phosphatase NrnA
MSPEPDAAPEAWTRPSPGDAGGIDLKPFASAVPDAVLERFRSARRVLAVGHENPDADTLGATLALGHLVEAAGGTVTLVSSDPVPPLYQFIPGIEAVRTDPEPGVDYDLLVLSDCASDERVGAVAARHPRLFAELPRVVIDHHASSSGRGQADWIDPDAAATCEMVALLAVRQGIPLTRGGGALATALMAGVVMDTATFAHPNATPRTLAVAAALVAAGAPLSDISRRLYRTKPESQLRLFGRVLDRLSATPDGRIVWSTLEPGDLEATGALAAHSEGIIDLLAQAEAAEVAILFKPQADGTTRVSVRTRPGGVDATVLTGTFGGGGHSRAAGATVPPPVNDARAAVLEVAARLAAEVAR